MSYASVAAHNAPSHDEQPQPDPALLTTATPTTKSVIDGTSKLNVVAPDFKEHPRTDAEDIPYDGDDNSPDTSPRKRPDAKKTRKPNSREEAALGAWQRLVNGVVRPQVASGLLGIVNVGFIAGAGYSFYSRPSLRSSTKAITSTVTAALALVLAEGYAAEQYSKTPEGQSAIRHARERRHWLVRYVRDFVARSNPYKGAVGILNTAVIGGVGYLGYTNRNVAWDRWTVTTLAAGLLALCGAEGYLLEHGTSR